MFQRLASIVVIGALVFGAFMIASVSASPRINARVRCANVAEDTLAHVRLVSFDRQDDGSVRVVYQCKSTGY